MDIRSAAADAIETTTTTTTTITTTYTVVRLEMDIKILMGIDQAQLP